MYVIDDAEMEAIRQAIRKKRLFRYHTESGECDLFERAFEKRLNVPSALLVTSGTNALVAALKAAGIGTGDKVVVPAYTFFATAAAVAIVGAIPIVVDIDDCLGLSVEELRRVDDDAIRAIIPVHMDGLSADIQPLCELAKNRGWWVIEDVAQAIGGTYKNRALGSWGDFGAFSLNENKIISCGEGGIIVTRSAESANPMASKLFTWHDGSAQFHPSQRDRIPTEAQFLGFSMRVSEITGAIMRVQLGRLDCILESLRARKRIFIETLQNPNQAKIVHGHDQKGDCATSLHLQFQDVPKAQAFLKIALARKLSFFPATARPAHASWKWGHLFSDNQTRISAQRRLQSIDILSRTLKMDVPFDLSLNDIQAQAAVIHSILSTL